jgi:hypothetical protein
MSLAAPAPNQTHDADESHPSLGDPDSMDLEEEEDPIEDVRRREEIKKKREASAARLTEIKKKLRPLKRRNPQIVFSAEDRLGVALDTYDDEEIERVLENALDDVEATSPLSAAEQALILGIGRSADWTAGTNVTPALLADKELHADLREATHHYLTGSTPAALSACLRIAWHIIQDLSRDHAPSAPGSAQTAPAAPVPATAKTPIPVNSIGPIS